MNTKLNFLMVLALLVILVSASAGAAQAQDSITIGPDILPEAVYLMPYSQQLTASGGAEPYSFSLLSGNLPGSIKLSSSGLLSGLTGWPVVPGTYPITIQVQDANLVTASRAYNFVLDKATPTVTANASGHPVGPAYWRHPFTLWVDVGIAIGNGNTWLLPGTVAFSVDGNPVPGCQAVVLESGRAVCWEISMDLDLGPHTFEAVYSPAGYEDYYYPATGSGTFTVEPGLYRIMGLLFEDFNQNGVDDSGEYRLFKSWTINLDQGCDGSVDYTTTTYDGVYQFDDMPGGQCYRITEVIGEPGWQQTTQLPDLWLSNNVDTMNIGNYYPDIILSPSELPSGNLGVEYNQVFIASGGAEPYTYTTIDGELPAGLALSEEGVLSGIPTATGDYQFMVKAEDANHAFVQKYYQVTIKTDGVFTFTSSSNPSAPGDPVTFTLSGSGDAVYPPVGLVTFSVDGMPIEGCPDLYLNYSLDTFEIDDYPVTCETAALTQGTHQITANYADLIGFYNDATLTLTQVVAAATPDLTIDKSHSGDFTQGQSGSYTLTVSNLGGGPASGTVTVVDTLPAGLTATALDGTGWNCTLATLTCTRSDPLSAGDSYPAIILDVSVASNAPASLTNSAAVSVDGEQDTANNTDDDPTTIQAQPGRITPANATCSQFASGTASDLNEAIYTVRSGRIKTVTPPAFLYYSKVIAPAARFWVKVSQSNNGGWPNLGFYPWSNVFDASCNRLFTIGIFLPASSTFYVTGATPGATYYVGIRYQANSVTGKRLTPPFPSVRYTFTTALNNVALTPNSDSINIRP